MAAPRSIRDAQLSVVIPVFDEEAVLPELARRLAGTLADLGCGFEVVLVDDGSTDKTPDLAAQIHDRDPRFKLVRLSRNFGHQAAVSAGLDHATGDVVCVMDADLQDPPEVLPRLLAEWERGRDVVYAVRRKRKESALKVASYHLFYRLLSHLSAVPMPIDAGDFCLISRQPLDAMKALPESERFVRGLRAWVGFEQVGIEYERAARHGGEPKYGVIGLLRLALSGIVSFSSRPLVYVFLVGLAVSLAAFAYGGWLVAHKLLFGGQITGYASLMGGLLFLSGIQLVSLGMIGIYVSKLFQEVKGRPTYVVRERRGFGTPEASPAATPEPRA